MYNKNGHKKIEIITRQISGLLENRNYIVFAYIFGSFVAQESFNDIDIGIVISNRAPISFAYHVIKGGIVIVDKNRDLRADFEGLTYKKYFDFRHLRIEYLREVANAPV
jgi:predicted nucleotidyltransferase